MNPRAPLSRRLGLALLAFLVLMSAAVFISHADTRGKLAGKVVDQQANALVGANVVIAGTQLGATADVDGQYAILNVPPGVYDVRCSAVGYQGSVVREVKISSGQTTTINFTLTESTIETAEIVTIAERPLVDTRQTSSVAILDREEIRSLPVQSLTDIVNLQAGVVDGHFRGGRAGEVQYQVDGVSVNNPYDNSSVLQLDKSVLQEVQVISGTFDAEYGQAMSGVVNAVLRSGSEEQYNASLEVYGGAYAVGPNDRASYPHTALSFPPAIQNVTGTISGPAGIAHTSFLLNVRRFVDDGYLWGTRRFVPTDASDFSQRTFQPTGDDGGVSLSYHREWSGQFKVSNRSIPDVQLSYQAIGATTQSKAYDFGYRLNPDGTRTQKNQSLVHGVDLTHTLSQNTFYTVSLRQNYFNYTDYAFSSVNDPHYQEAGAPRGDPNYELGAIIQGYDLGRFEQKTNSFLVKASLTSQVTKAHLVKFGVEAEVSRISFGAPGTLTSEITGPDAVTRLPAARFVVAAGENLLPTELLGVRSGPNGSCRHSSSRRHPVRILRRQSQIPGDLANPANSIAGAPHRLRNEQRRSLPSPRGSASRIRSRRPGRSIFPTVISIRCRRLGNLYANSDYYVLRNLQASATSYGVMGNPDIKPEFTAQYEFGFKEQFGGCSAWTFLRSTRTSGTCWAWSSSIPTPIPAMRGSPMSTSARWSDSNSPSISGSRRRSRSRWTIPTRTRSAIRATRGDGQSCRGRAGSPSATGTVRLGPAAHAESCGNLCARG